MEFYTVEPCATSNAFEIHFKGDRRVDIGKAAKLLAKLGEVLAQTPVVLVLKDGVRSASIYASGRIMLRGVDRGEAEKLGRKYAEALEKGGALK